MERRDSTPGLGPQPHAGAVRALGIVRWLLPFGLMAVALTVEVSEHAAERASLSPGFWAELALFAIGGPVAVAITLGWVRRLVLAHQATSATLASMNRGLEAIVAERTAHVEAAGRELAAINAELARANEELRQVDRLKSEFVSLVSHQLRAPLTNITGALELVAEDAALLPPQSQRTLRILSQESQRLSHLIQAILDVSRLEAGRLTLSLGPVALEPLLARAAASAFAGEPGRSHSLHVPAGSPPAWGDEMLLEEIARNLLENAIRYSPPSEPIETTVSLGDGTLRVAVTDHGPGVPPAERENVFHSFYRVGSGETAVAGYGLGLYFARKLAHAQGGNVWVESPVWPDAGAPGARFVFTIPIAEEVPDDEPAEEVGWRCRGS
jgi:signal transduction histidine kinase